MRSNEVSGAVIETNALNKIYRFGFFNRKRHQALKDVSFSVQPGEVFGLLGANGAGKTTLVKILLGIARCTSGTAILLGEHAGKARARLRVGYLPENLRIERHHTPRSALRMYGRLSRMPGKAIDTRSDLLLERVGLSDRRSEPIYRFSKGMLQRLGIAQALMHDPDLLILDEPTDGLDPIGRADVRRLILQMRDEGKTVFLNSHILHEVERICDRVAILADGSLRGIGPVDELTAATGQLQLQLTLDQSANAAIATLPESLAGCSKPLPCEDTGTDSNSKSCQLVVSVDATDQIDLYVDAFRAAKIGIRHLEVTRPTLESVFVALVSSNPKDPEPLPAQSLANSDTIVDQKASLR